MNIALNEQERTALQLLLAAARAAFNAVNDGEHMIDGGVRVGAKYLAPLHKAVATMDAELPPDPQGFSLGAVARAEWALRRLLATPMPSDPPARTEPWLPMESAPRDGTLLRLLVDFEDHSTEDAQQAPTIGSNNRDHDGEDVWTFAGWCWTHDHWTQGVGKPIGWLPYFAEIKVLLPFKVEIQGGLQ